MDKLERERHVNLNLPMVLERPPVELPTESASCPSIWRRHIGMCDSHVEVATIKPRAPDHGASSACRINRTRPGHNQVTADEALRHLNEARAQETVEHRQTHAKVSNETSRAPRMLDKTTGFDHHSHRPE
jgi:hypothetical protein